jgi:hypothetical protein
MRTERKKPVAEQRKHPVAYASLMVATLSPMVAGITALGMFLRRLFPSPDALQITAGAGAFILLTPVLMCVGAYCWLVVARRVVERSVAKAFFIHGGFGILSRVSECMFIRVYGEGDEDRRA